MRVRPSSYCLLNGKSLRRSKPFACKCFKGKLIQCHWFRHNELKHVTKLVISSYQMCFVPQSFTPWTEERNRRRVSLHQRWTQHDFRTDGEILQEVTHWERLQTWHRGISSLWSLNAFSNYYSLLYPNAFQQTLSFCLSAGCGLKSAKVPQSVSRRVSSIGTCLYKLWNNQAGPFYVTLCIGTYLKERLHIFSC